MRTPKHCQLVREWTLHGLIRVDLYWDPEDRFYAAVSPDVPGLLVKQRELEGIGKRIKGEAMNRLAFDDKARAKIYARYGVSAYEAGLPSKDLPVDV